jgi:hypothetical protein
MKIERVSANHVRFTLPDGTVHDRYGDKVAMDFREAELRQMSPQGPVANAVSLGQYEEPMLAPTMTFDRDDVIAASRPSASSKETTVAEPTWNAANGQEPLLAPEWHY